MKFYYMSTEWYGKRGKRYTRAIPVNGFPCDTVHCDVCGREWQDTDGIFREHRAFPIVFVGDYFANMICSGFIDLVDESVKNLFEQNGIKTAFFTEMPVIAKNELTREQMRELRDSIGNDVYKMHNKKPVYYGLYVDHIGIHAHADMKYVWRDTGEEVCKHCGYGVGYRSPCWENTVLDLATWDGSDLFLAREKGICHFCTEKLKRIIEEAGLTGFSFDEVEVK